MRFDMRRPDLPGSRMALPPPPSLLRMTPRPVQAQPPAQMVVYGGQPVPRPAAASLPLGAPQVPPASFNVPPPQRQFPPGIPPTSPPVLGLPQQHQHQPPGVLVVHRQPPPTQHPLPSRPPHLTVPMAGPVSVHGPPSAVIPLAVPHVSGPLPPAETRWPTSHTVDAFNPLLPPPASAVSAPQYLARLPPPPTAADVGGAVHMAATGPPPLNIVHAVPLNYNIPPPAVPVAASAGHLSYMTVAQAVSSAPASANMVTAQYTDVYGRQQTYEYESVGHVQAVQAPPSADRSSPRQSASTYRDSSSYYEPVPEHRHKRRAASSPDRNSDRDMPATTQQSVERSDRSPKKPKPERQLSSLTDKEFDDILQRNKSVSSGAIMRAVQDASAGDFALAIETLVTAISLIKQSKIAADDRCKILISSLQDTLHGIESKSYGSKVTNRQSSSDRRSRSRERERSRERNRERSSTQKSSSSRHMSRSDEYRSSGSAAAEPRESRHHDTLASSASSSSSFERHRVSDKMERDRGDRGSEHNVREMRESRESRESRDIRETRDRDRDRDRDVEGDYISRSSRR